MLRQAMAEARQAMAEAGQRNGGKRLSSRRRVEPGDKLGPAVRCAARDPRPDSATAARAPAAPRPGPAKVREQLPRVSGVVVDRGKVQNRRQPDRRRSRAEAAASRANCAASALAASAAKRHSSARTLVSAGSSRCSHASMTFCTSGGLSPSPGSPTCVLERGERGAKGEQDARLQASAAGERGEAFPLRLEDEGGDARQRQARQFRQSVREQSPVSAKQRTQSKAGVSEPAARSARVSSARSSGRHDEAIVQSA